MTASIRVNGADAYTAAQLEEWRDALALVRADGPTEADRMIVWGYRTARRLVARLWRRAEPTRLEALRRLCSTEPR